MFLLILVAIVCLVVGAYSHKWLAAEVTKETGLNALDPEGAIKQVAADVAKKL